MHLLEGSCVHGAENRAFPLNLPLLRKGIGNSLRGSTAALLSYQHGFHAGNQADVHKHCLLLGLLSLIAKKARPITYIESHAGRGLYDLAGEQAQKTGEWRSGIGAIYEQAGLPTPLARYRDVVARWNRGEAILQYPGSPCIAGGALRKRDKLVLFEQHGTEFQALETAMTNHYRHAEAIRGDGYDGMFDVFSDHDPRHRLIAMIDPSYELKEDFTRAPTFAERLVALVPDALVMLWYPVLSRDEIGLEHAVPAPQSGSFHSIIRFPQHREGHRMVGSGMVIYGDISENRRPLKVLDRALQAHFAV
ncbi:MAG: 23S rRNA (adenine(2030)-N(6))-methyltransferase RlmJ [Rhodospirillaceae bacterium]|nr:23S rRNA (adenine(2030)-N(6))-methyltransferase RlmJ [Rhodospirillaceae bacterium]